jgi:hypothetical protein
MKAILLLSACLALAACKPDPNYRPQPGSLEAQFTAAANNYTYADGTRAHPDRPVLDPNTGQPFDTTTPFAKDTGTCKPAANRLVGETC